MNRARSFFYVCLGILTLALAYHFGATTATAQAPGNSVVAVDNSYNGGHSSAFTANGDVYRSQGAASEGPWVYAGNIFGGGPTPTKSISIGQLKLKYAK
jgi:hypothetical protein